MRAGFHTLKTLYEITKNELFICRNPSLMRAGFHMMKELAELVRDVARCRNPSLMRAGFHKTEKSGKWSQGGGSGVAIPR